MKPPIGRVGSKMILAPRIISLFPGHETYVEPFGGSAAVLFAKPKAEHEVYNDADPIFCTFFRALQKNPAELHRIVSLTPHSRTEHRHAVFQLRSPNGLPDIEIARCLFVVSFQGFGSDIGLGWCFNKTVRSHLTQPKIRRKVEQIFPASRRFRHVDIRNEDFRSVLRDFDRPKCLWYLDPPYIVSTRHNKASIYQFEMTERDHRQLVDIAWHSKAAIVISGYAHPIYDALENFGWYSTTVCARTRLTANRQHLLDEQRRTEKLWWNEQVEEARSE